jgi:hypothetical protein
MPPGFVGCTIQTPSNVLRVGPPLKKKQSKYCGYWDIELIEM